MNRITPITAVSWNLRRRRCAVIARLVVMWGCCTLLLGCGSSREQETTSTVTAVERLTVPPALELTGVDLPVRQALDAAAADIRHSPDSAAAWGKLGQLLLAHKVQCEVGLAALVQAELREPSQPRWPYLQGHELASHDPPAAVTKLQRAVELGGPEVQTSRLLLAETLAAEGRTDEALQLADAVLAGTSFSARAELLRGRLLLAQGKLDDAQAALERTLGDSASVKRAWELLAQVHQRRDAAGAAQQALQAAAASPPGRNWLDVYAQDMLHHRQGRREDLEVADRLLAQNQPQDALIRIQATLSRYPDFGWAWLLKGRAHLALSQPQPAVAALKRSLELLPESVESHFYLGAALLQRNQLSAAAASFRRAAEITPDFAEAWYQLAECESKLAHPDQAITALRQAVQAKPQYDAAQYRLAQLLHARGDHASALPHAQAAAQLLPQNPAPRRLIEEINTALPGSPKPPSQP